MPSTVCWGTTAQGMPAASQAAFSFSAVPFALADEANGPVMPEDPDILAKAALLVDADTGAVAYAKNEHQELYPASLTKVMTALLVLEAVEDGKLSLELLPYGGLLLKE